METQEEVMGSKDQTQINKGKRIKRPRPQSPLALTMASSSTSSSTEEEGFGYQRANDYNSNGILLNHQVTACSSPTTSSVEFTQSTEEEEEEEEDMANCLILLAKGRSQKSPAGSVAAAAATTLTRTKPAGFYVYECKTCNRCFPSFQALGGHRASHKKPKALIEAKKFKASSSSMDEKDEEKYVLNSTNTNLSLQIASRANFSCNLNKFKVHECSVCGVEFSSGQALGGHMRRHRTFTGNNIIPNQSIEAKKPRNNILSLDLNLPAAPDDDFLESKFPFASKERVLVFSASPFVHCRY